MRAVVAELACAQCDERFIAPKTEVRRGRKYCSARCRNEAQKGEGNHNFRGWSSKRARHYVDRFRAKNPDKARAHDVVKNARRDGRLIAQPCEVCGATEAQTKIHAHHDDYSKPLEVRWLCGAHHRAAHRQPRQSPGEPDAQRV